MNDDPPAPPPFLSPDDPRLTAFALGEIEPAGQAEAAAAVAADPALRETAADIRATAALLTAALASEPTPSAPPLAVAGTAPVVRRRPGTRRARGKLVRFPRPPIVLEHEPRRFPHFLVASAAVACFAGWFFGIYMPAYRERLATRWIEVPLGLPTVADTAPASEPPTVALDDARAPATAPATAETSPPPADASTAFVAAAEQPSSSFSLEVDTASWATVSRAIEAGRLPPPAAIRIEELLASFAFDYPPPPPTDPAPIAASLEVAEAPWKPGHRLVRIGLKGREVDATDRRPANLAVLVDVSGSMSAPDKLPLVKRSLRLLVERLGPEDRVAIAAFPGPAGLLLPSTPAAQRDTILAAIDRLRTETGARGGSGIESAWAAARAGFVPGGINRVVLATDGSLDPAGCGKIVRLAAEAAAEGIGLAPVGFGTDPAEAGSLRRLASAAGNACAFVATDGDARRVFAGRAAGTAPAIATGVRVQVAFNPETVAAYRILGYEEASPASGSPEGAAAAAVEAGHAMTALYEVVPRTVAESSRQPAPLPAAPELLEVRLRYTAPDGATSGSLAFPLEDRGTPFAAASRDFRFAAAVAAFGMALSDSPHMGQATLADAVAWAEGAEGDDASGERKRFVALAKRALTLKR